MTFLTDVLLMDRIFCVSYLTSAELIKAIGINANEGSSVENCAPGLPCRGGKNVPVKAEVRVGRLIHPASQRPSNLLEISYMYV